MGKRGPKPGEPKVKRLISISATTDANIEREAKKRKKPMTVPAFIAQALENKFGEKPIPNPEKPAKPLMDREVVNRLKDGSE